MRQERWNRALSQAGDSIITLQLSAIETVLDTEWEINMYHWYKRNINLNKENVGHERHAYAM